MARLCRVFPDLLQVNYPPLTQGACSEDLMETTTMQFDSHEGCFSQPYSCRPVDAAPTDYPWTHGIIGYLLPTRQRTSYASSSVVETSSSGVSVSALVHSGSTRGHKNIMEEAIPPPACAGGLLARRDEKIENDDLTMCRKNLGVSEFSTAKSVCAPICAPLWSTAANAANSLRLLSGVLDPGTVARVKTESPAGCDPCDHGEGSVSITGGTGEGFYTQPVRERGAREGVR